MHHSSNLLSRCSETEGLPVYICFDFITRDTCLDHFVCFVNEPFLINKKYKFNLAAREFSVWFKNIQHETVDVTKFVLEWNLCTVNEFNPASELIFTCDASWG